jgi:hypothetical protein
MVRACEETQKTQATAGVRGRLGRRPYVDVRRTTGVPIVPIDKAVAGERAYVQWMPCYTLVVVVVCYSGLQS